MKRRTTFIVSITAAVGLAAFAASQMIITPNANRLGFNDMGYGNGAAVNQLWIHAQILERELVQQQETVLKLEKDLKEQKEKFTKLEKRVRNMELRGK